MSIDDIDLLGDAVDKLDYKALNKVFAKLEDATDSEPVAQEYLSTLVSQVGPTAAAAFDPEMLDAAIDKAFDDVREVTGGKFSVETYVCYVFSGLDPDATPKTYNELATKLTTTQDTNSNGSSSSSSSSSSDNPMSEMTDMLSDLAGTLGGAGKYLGYVFYALLVMLLPWFLFILLGTIHIFIKNKRAATWYVFTFGFWPCLIFWGLPTIVKLVLPKLVSKMAGGAIGSANIAGMLGAISSFAWISGIVLVVMWVMWLFWMRPLKKAAKLEQRGA